MAGPQQTASYVAGFAPACCQPLDKAIFQSFKASMRNAATFHIAKHIGVGGNAGQSIKDMGMNRAFKRSDNC
eukprot:3987998-Amphidinium_carterae.1